MVMEVNPTAVIRKERDGTLSLVIRNLPMLPLPEGRALNATIGAARKQKPFDQVVQKVTTTCVYYVPQVPTLDDAIDKEDITDEQA
jgi:hypothetical protein